MNTTHKKVGIVVCSNGQKASQAEKLKTLETTLQEMGLVPVCSNYIYEKENIFSGTAKERAEALMDFYGDVANGVLPYLDYELIAASNKRFWGYSDLTTVLNAIYTKTGKPSVLYQIRNLLYDHRERQIADFSNVMLEKEDALFRITYRFVQGKEMHGVVVGGNIRCFLKLAGTEYMPDLNGKILLLESFGGTVAKMETYLCQLQQLGAFDKVAGILLGTFTEMEAEHCTPTMEMLVKRMVGTQLPIAVTREIGHGTDAKGIMIGKMCKFCVDFM